MQNEPDKTLAEFKESIEHFKQMLERYQYNKEHQTLSQHTTKEVLANLLYTQKTYRRWFVALSALTVVSCITLAFLAIQVYQVPIIASAHAANKPVQTSRNTEKTATAGISTAPTPIPSVVEEKAPTAEPIPTKEPANLLSASKAKRAIKNRSKYALTYFSQAKFEYLAKKYIHPEKGIHFYPSGLKAAGKTFTARAFKNAMFNPIKYDWGAVSADEEPIKHRFIGYYKNYIYDQDFLSAEKVHFNEVTFPGKNDLSLESIASTYPDCVFAEYRENEKSLILVFERYDGPGVWYLVGVIHNE